MITCVKKNRKIHIGQNIALLFFCVIYVVAVNRLLTDSYYVNSTPVVSYGKSFSLYRFILCIIVVELLFWFTMLVKTNKMIIYYTIRFLFVLYCVPVVMSFCLFDYDHSFLFFLYSILYWVMICICSARVSIRFKPFLKKKFSSKIQKALLILSIFVSCGYIISQMSNFRFSLSFSDVYAIRQDFKNNTSYMGGVLKSSIGMYICPCLIVYYLQLKKRNLTVVFVILEIAVFSLAKDKIYLLMLAVSLIVGVLGKKMIHSTENFFSYILIGLGGLNIVSLMGYFQNFIFNIFARRFFVVPAWLNYLYFEFFLGKEKIWWRQDTFLPDDLFGAVYSDSVTKLISKKYFNEMVSNPNAGMVAEAFSQCGLLGIIVYPIGIALLLNILNQYFNYAKKEVVIILAFGVSVSLSNDTITSPSFLGVMIIILIYSYIFKEKGEDIDA